MKYIIKYFDKESKSNADKRINDVHASLISLFYFIWNVSEDNIEYHIYILWSKSLCNRTLPLVFIRDLNLFWSKHVLCTILSIQTFTNTYHGKMIFCDTKSLSTAGPPMITYLNIKFKI